MKKTFYQTPGINVIEFQSEGILCGSDPSTFGTGASWGTEDAGNSEGFIL